MAVIFTARNLKYEQWSKLGKAAHSFLRTASICEWTRQFITLCFYTKHTHNRQRYLGDTRTGINLYADDGEPIAVAQIDLVVNAARAAIMT